jgi:hypothetical protein
VARRGGAFGLVISGAKALFDKNELSADFISKNNF